jgi:hypothetical protein
MRLRALFQLLVLLTLSACTSIAISPTATHPPPDLPDLVVASVYLGMQGIPGNSSNCVPAYAPYEIRAVLENRGAGPADNVLVAEQSTGQQVQVGTILAGQSLEIIIPLNTSGSSYIVVADPQNSVPESDENNNTYSYLAPTPTPPAICPPTQPASLPTLPPATPSPLSLDGLHYADMNLAQIWKVLAGGHPNQIMNGIAGQFSPDGLQVLFESSGDLWLAEPMDNPGRNLTNTADRYEQFPQWWAANPAKVVFNSVGSSEAQEKDWNQDVSGYPTMMNRDGSEYVLLSDVPSYTRPGLSPDGRTIAYDRLGVPMLHEIGGEARLFDISRYGHQAEIANVVFTSPSFSPDGRWLTWWAFAITSEAQRHFSLVMLDLTANTSRVAHAYTALAGTSGWLETPVWSPDGQWLAFQTRGEDAPRALWVVHRDGEIRQRFGPGTNPVWSPDSQRLAFVQWPPNSDSYLAANLSIIEVPSWNIQPAGLPAGSIPLAWTVIASP